MLGRRAIAPGTPTYANRFLPPDVTDQPAGSLDSIVGQDLELHARSILQRSHPPREPGDPLDNIEHELTLLLDQIDQARKLERSFAGSLLKNECYIDTELMQMEMRTPRYSPYRFPERDKLQRRLLEIEKERRNSATAQVDRLQALHQRLLALLGKHAVLDQ